jgi:hypothetical protein
VFQDGEFVSGLKIAVPKPVVVIMLGSPWPPTEATKGRLGYGQPFFWRRKVHTAAALLKYNSVPEFQECVFEHYQKGTRSCLDGV